MRFFLLFVVLIILGSCVSNRKVQLLQKDDVNKKILPHDTTLRTYALDTFEYKLQANDLVYVSVVTPTDKEFNFFSTGGTQQNMNTGGTMGGGSQTMGDIVDEQGNIPLPVIGKVQVAGLTVFEAQEKLQKIVSGYVETPVVKVRLLNYRITVLGEVGNQGTIVLNNNRVTMLEAIGSVGGFTEMADRKNVKLVRQTGSETEVQYINLLSEDFMQSPFYYVHQNDVLVVPPLRQRPLRMYLTQNISLVVSVLSLAALVLNLTLNNPQP